MHGINSTYRHMTVYTHCACMYFITCVTDQLASCSCIYSYHFEVKFGSTEEEQRQISYTHQLSKGRMEERNYGRYQL